MKIVLAIIASNNENYNKFKNIWVDNINYFKINSKYSSYIDFYFLYSEKLNSQSQIPILKNYTFHKELYMPYEIENRKIRILFKTCTFFNFIYSQIDTQDFNFVIRTNLSTFFDLNTMYEWIFNFNNKYKLQHIFGGPIIDELRGPNTMFSGTCLLLSKPVVNFIGKSYYRILNSIDRYKEFFKLNNKEFKDSDVPEDDELISKYTLYNYPENLLYNIHINRIEIIEQNNNKYIVYHKCTAENPKDIFIFRFKTLYRNYDIQQMQELLNYIQKECIDEQFNCIEFFNFLSKNINLPIIYSDKPHYKIYSQAPFKANSMITP